MFRDKVWVSFAPTIPRVIWSSAAEESHDVLLIGTAGQAPIDGRNHKISIALWVVQAVLALAFIAAGSMKVFAYKTYKAMAHKMARRT